MTRARACFPKLVLLSDKGLKKWGEANTCTRIRERYEADPDMPAVHRAIEDGEAAAARRLTES